MNSMLHTMCNIGLKSIVFTQRQSIRSLYSKKESFVNFSEKNKNFKHFFYFRNSTLVYDLEFEKKVKAIFHPKLALETLEYIETLRGPSISSKNLLSNTPARNYSSTITKKIIDPNDLLKKTSFIMQELNKNKKFTFKINYNDEMIPVTIQCPLSTQLNDTFLENRNHGVAWLEEIGLFDGLCDTDKDYAVKYRQKLESTNISLLAALVMKKELKIKSKTNAWLFVCDNLFDKKNSPLHNPVLAESVFDIYKNAFLLKEIQKLDIKALNLPSIIEWQVEVLAKGIKNIAEDIKKVMPEEKFINQVLKGFDRYKFGNISEAESRFENTLHNMSFSHFHDVRSCAGAVDFVFEVSLALHGIFLPNVIKDDTHWLSFRDQCKAHICTFNDLVSFDKEKKEGLSENLVLILANRFKGNENENEKKAIGQVEEELSVIMNEIVSREKPLQIWLKKLESDGVITQKTGLVALEAIELFKLWVSGHIVWELASDKGRHIKGVIFAK